MVDLETMGTDPNTVILTVGAVPFGGDGNLIMEDNFYFYERVQLQSYDKYKNGEFNFSWDTLIWWLKQDKDPLEDAFLLQPRYPIWVVMQDFANWISIVCNMCNDNKINIWSHGKDFDVVVLQNAFKVCGIVCPWKYWDTRDTRTLYALAGIDMRDISMTKGFKSHNAVGDCFKQIEGIRRAYNVINSHINTNNTNNTNTNTNTNTNNTNTNNTNTNNTNNNTNTNTNNTNTNNTNTNTNNTNTNTNNTNTNTNNTNTNTNNTNTNNTNTNNTNNTNTNTNTKNNTDSTDSIENNTDSTDSIENNIGSKVRRSSRLEKREIKRQKN
jgi:hypothetical protein